MSMRRKCLRPVTRSTRGRDARIRPQPSQHATILRDLVVALRGLENLHDTGESGIAHDAAERLGAERALRDELVTVAAGVERRLRVVEVEAGQPLQADRVLPPPPDSFVVAPQVVAGRVEVTGIGAEGDPVAHRAPDRLAQAGQLLERAAERGPGSGGRFQEHADRAGHRLEAARDGFGVARDAGVAIVDEIAGMRHDRRDAERGATLELGAERRLGSLAQRPIGGREVD